MSRNYDLTGIAPQNVWKYFYEISQIPRNSGDKQRITDYLMDFCKKHGLKAHRDEAMNVVALVPATPGYEDLPSVILHSHVDMVCIKAEGVEHDFSKDPIRAYAEGDKVLAEGTTLGGDDGIGMAFMLALMEDTESPHPALECVFTTDEETDMNGGVALDYSQFKSKYYINIDGCGVAIGSAGELDFRVVFENARATMGQGMKTYRITVDGLLGGHGGLQAVLERANAIALLSRTLLSARTTLGLHIVSVKGGRPGGCMATAIPQTAEAVVAVPAEAGEALASLVQAKRVEFAKEYSKRDPGLTLTLEECACPEQTVMAPETEKNLMALLNLFPNGLCSTHQYFEDTLGSTANVGVLETRETEIEIAVTLRSTHDRRYYLYEKSVLLCDLLHMKTEIICDLPAWEVSVSDEFMALIKEIYPDYPPYILGGTGEIGFFATRIPNLNVVSLTPYMNNCHSVTEYLSISECKIFYDRMLEVLRRMKELPAPQ